MQTTTTRRDLLKVAPAATALAVLPGAATAATLKEPAPDEDDRYTKDDVSASYERGSEIAYLWMARAWVDRWKALGGDFGIRFDKDYNYDGLMRGMVCDLDLWNRPDEGREDISPHVCITRERDHSGAVKALEGLLELCPGLKDAVREVGVQEAWQRFAKVRAA